MGDVGGLVEVFVVVAEHLVDVRVDPEGAFGTERGRGVGPCVRASECVVHHNHEIRVGRCISDGLVGVFGELHRRVEIVAAFRQGFVDEFQADDGVGVLGRAVLLSHGRQDRDRLLEIISLLPQNRTSMTGIVEAVLGARLSVTIDPYLHAGRSRPANGFFEVSVGAFQVRGSGVVISPEADGDAKSGSSEQNDIEGRWGVSQTYALRPYDFRV